jgi:predicted DNA-binding WGR domain protein
MATTLKVSETTRDRVKAFSDAEHRTADQVINAALDELEAQRRRRRMREQSRAGMADPADQEAVAALRVATEDVRAW